jgi:hypothetical protein
MKDKENKNKFVWDEDDIRFVEKEGEEEEED